MPTTKFDTNLLLLLLQPTSEGGAERGHNAKHAANNVAKSDGKEVAGKELAEGDLSTTEHTKRDHEHVGNAVLKAKSNKGRNGEPNGGHLADQTGAAGCHVDGHAHEPVAHDATNKCLLEGERCLHGGDIDRSRKSTESSRCICEVGEEERTDKVADVAGNPRLGQFSLGTLTLHERGTNKSGIASEKFAASDERHDEAERKAESAENDLYNWMVAIAFVQEMSG